MRILADENISRGVIVALRVAGHDVVWAVETGRRAPDRVHMASANSNGRAILTEDTDFAKLAHEAEMERPWQSWARSQPHGPFTS